MTKTIQVQYFNNRGSDLIYNKSLIVVDTGLIV